MMKNYDIKEILQDIGMLNSYILKRTLIEHCISELSLNLLGTQKVIITTRIKSNSTLIIHNKNGHNIVFKSITQAIGSNNINYAMTEVFQQFYIYYVFEEQNDLEINHIQVPSYRILCDTAIPEDSQINVTIGCNEPNEDITIDLYFYVPFSDP